MQINKNELKTSLDIVRGGLSTKGIIEQSDHFAFFGGKIVTYNDEISLAHPVKNLEIEGSIPAEELSKFLQKVKTDEIDIDQTDSEIEITSGRATIGLKIDCELKLPIKEISSNNKWVDLPLNFTQALKFTSETCSNDFIKPVLTGVHITSEFCESSDNYRISRYYFDTKIPINNTIIPANTIKEVIKLNPAEVNVSDGWVHFRNEKQTVLSCRTIEGEFPDTGRFLKVKGDSIKFPKNLSEIIDKALIFHDANNNSECSVQMNKNSTVVRSESEKGWFEEKSKNQSKKECSFYISPQLFKFILSQTSEGVITDNCLLFKGTDWEHLIMLIVK